MPLTEQNKSPSETPSRPRGRPVKYPLPEPIPDTPENVARIIMSRPPKKVWRYLKTRNIKFKD